MTLITMDSIDVGGFDLKTEELWGVGIGGIDLKSESRDEGKTKKMKCGGGGEAIRGKEEDKGDEGEKE